MVLELSSICGFDSHRSQSPTRDDFILWLMTFQSLVASSGTEAETITPLGVS